MNAARRLDQLEQAEEQRFRAAAAEFATFWRGNVWDEARQARTRATLRAAGCDGDVLAFLERQRLAQPPGDQALFDDMALTVFGLVEGAYDDAAIRAALARLAPQIGCRSDAPPVLLVRQLQATIAATPL
jgi:hypothetical protein